MKKKVSDLPESFINRLESGGLTYSDMMNDYNLTRWGARKLTDNAMIKEEKAGNHEKIFYLKNETGSEAEEIGAIKVPVSSEETNYEEAQRNTQAAKQTITNKATNYLAQLEHEVKSADTNSTEFEEPDYESNGFTAIIHETDSHFSAHVKNRRGDVIYDTDTAVLQTREAFSWYADQIHARPGNLDDIVILLGGDLLEGEDIYESQAHEIRKSLDDQIKAARRAYFEEIKWLKELFGVPIKIVCVSGNHGDLGTTSGANADDIIYSMLEDMINLSDIGGVKFVKSDRSDYTTFNYRNWKGYLTHGENRRGHIGTSSPQSDWLAIKDEFGFDAAWRGHYHTQKRETVNGAPVYMTNSRKPGDDYTDTLTAFDNPGNAIYFGTDLKPVQAVITQTIDYS